MQAEALHRISSEQGLVMVSTDAAARGLDIPHVTHVVQADFASSAVDFIHRVSMHILTVVAHAAVGSQLEQHHTRATHVNSFHKSLLIGHPPSIGDLCRLA